MLRRPIVAEVMHNMTAQQLMLEMDTTVNGRISWDEFRAYLDKRYSYKLVEYYSELHRTWISTQVVARNKADGSVQVKCKPGVWIDRATQAARIRAPRR